MIMILMQAGETEASVSEPVFQFLSEGEIAETIFFIYY
jgi:hypothetical protein